MDEKWLKIMSCCIKVVELLYNKRFIINGSKKGNPVYLDGLPFLGV